RIVGWAKHLRGHHSSTSGMDGGHSASRLCPPYELFVVPAKAGTHNHSVELLKKCDQPVCQDNNGLPMGPGSALRLSGTTANSQLLPPRLHDDFCVLLRIGQIGKCLGHAVDADL